MVVRWTEKQREHVYGGLLTENIMQSMARDVLTEAINRIEDRGFHVCHHIYDQCLIHCPAEDAETAAAVAYEEFTRSPAWAPDLPLGAEYVIGDSYARDNSPQFHRDRPRQTRRHRVNERR
jgi:DNA polymerase